MKILTKITILCLISFNLLAINHKDLMQGHTLHDESCVNCHIAKHDKDFYTKKDSRVKDLKSLKKMVNFCSTQLSTSWFPEEEQNVVDYLNMHFYQFKN